ncbi:YcaO-like family protein [Amycolatopsis sp. NPDC059657]|uniref:YcaO-like family protein n=1 Tax=Amycolatopsis sp. NPDC059657 TaxID=3346899 RepID=UPI00366BBA74
MANLAPAGTSAMTDAAAALRARLSPLVGMLGPVLPATPLRVPEGSPGLPIACSSVGDLRWPLPEVAVFAERTGAPTTGLDGAGGGFDADLAEWVAVAEALERYCSAVYSRDQLVTATADELGTEALDLDTLPRLSERELADKLHDIGPARKDLPRSWVRGVRLADARLTWIPAELVWLCFHDPGVTRITAPNTTGCAIHSDPWQALLNGLLEVIERDAISIVWHQRLPLPEIEVDSGFPELEQLLAQFDTNPGLSMRLFDATLDLGVPTVYAVYQEHHSPHLRQVLGCGINPSPGKAAANAVREAISCRLALEYRGDEVPTEAGMIRGTLDGALYMGKAEHAEAFDFLLGPGRAGGTIRLSDLRTGATARDPKQYLTELLARMGEAGLDVFAVDIGCDESREAGLTAVKAIVPGLQPLSFTHRAQFLGSPRLFAAPAACGYPVRQPGELNPWPQPFA